nr:replicative DNA helicase [uncultured Romboutsia sp.]
MGNDLFYRYDDEKSILGGIILDNANIELCNLIKSEDFYIDEHKQIFNVMLELHSKRIPIDLITLTSQLKNNGLLNEVLNEEYISNLTCVIPTQNNIKYYIDIVKDASNKRKVIDSTKKLLCNIIQGKDLVASLTLFHEEINSYIIEEKNEDNTLKNIVAQIISNIDSKPEDKIKTGIYIIDKCTNGIGKNELVAIGASSGVGKSAIALNIAYNAYSKQGKKVLIITREMSKKDVGERLLLCLSNVDRHKYESRTMNNEERERLFKVASDISTNDIVVDDRISTIHELKMEIRRFKPELIIVDYVQLLTPSSTKETRERQVAELSRQLKSITLDFGVPVIQLTQLADKGNGNYKPRGETYTRESRAIYQDSNIVIYINKTSEESELKEAYKNTAISKYGTFDDMKTTIKEYESLGVNFLEVIVDKNRNGLCGSDYYWFEGKTLRYNQIV